MTAAADVLGETYCKQGLVFTVFETPLVLLSNYSRWHPAGSCAVGDTPLITPAHL